MSELVEVGGHCMTTAEKKEMLEGIARSIDSPFTFESVCVWCQPHTGARGQNNRNAHAANRVAEDWNRLKRDVANGNSGC